MKKVQLCDSQCALGLIVIQLQTDRKSLVIFRILPFLMTVNDPNPNFKGMLLFDAEYLRNGTR